MLCYTNWNIPFVIYLVLNYRLYRSKRNFYCLRTVTCVKSLYCLHRFILINTLIHEFLVPTLITLLKFQWNQIITQQHTIIRAYEMFNDFYRGIIIELVVLKDDILYLLHVTLISRLMSSNAALFEKIITCLKHVIISVILLWNEEALNHVYKIPNFIIMMKFYLHAKINS